MIDVLSTSAGTLVAVLSAVAALVVVGSAASLPPPLHPLTNGGGDGHDPKLEHLRHRAKLTPIALAPTSR